MSAYYDEVIEIGILKVRNNTIIDQYSQLIQPEHKIDDFITALTGITNEMIAGMPSIRDTRDNVLSFIGFDVIVGHNTSFDIRFLNDGFHHDLENQYMDTIQFARKLYPEIRHHRLSDLTKYLRLSNNAHRSIADCIATKELYDSEKSRMIERGLKIEDLWMSNNGHHGGHGIDIHSIVPSVEVSSDGFFCNRHVVFTEKLEKMLRKDAMQLVVNLGGVLDNTVTKKMNYLVLGNNDYNAILRGEKSSKHKKAEKLKLDGQDIEIIDELTFYDILKDEGTL